MSEWVDQEADVNDAKAFDQFEVDHLGVVPDEWQVVNTDNFGNDYPNESFAAGGPYSTKAAARAVADHLNGNDGNAAPLGHR